jgi:uncharacterized protein (TIGR03032 family)
MNESNSAAKAPLEITTSNGFADWLAEQDASLAFTTNAAGKCFLVGIGAEGKLSMFERSFDRTLGLYAEDNTILMGSQFQVWRFDNALAPGQNADGFDRLYMPQVAYTTGDVLAHDVALSGNGTVVFANTLFSCLASVSDEFSFNPIWRPPFISELAPEDRCHLTGVAMEGGVPRFVTAAAQTDEAGGWKAEAADGGCIIDAQNDAIVAEGLSLPGAPRLHKRRLWIANAGSGEIGMINLKSGTFEPVAFCPGYVSGLAFVGDYAIAGTSKHYEGYDVGGLPIDANLKSMKAEARCALVVVDTKVGELVHWLRLEGVIDEIYDVAILPGAKRPAAIGLRGDDIRRVVSIAPEAKSKGGRKSAKKSAGKK